MPAESPTSRLSRTLASVMDLIANRDDEIRITNAIAELNNANHGVCASNRIDMSVIPTDADTLTIGDDVYEFLDLSGGENAVATDGNIAVEIKASATLTLDALIDAINGVDDSGNWANNATDTSTSTGVATAVGTQAIVADEIGTDILRIRSADGIGGSPVAPDAAADVDIACSETGLDAGSVWDHANMDLSPYRVAGGFMAMASVTITAAMVTTGFVRVCFPFVVEGFGIMQILDSSGVIQTIDTASQADAYTIDNGDVLIDPDATNTNLAATDVITIVAWGTTQA